jgi:hypothetical protein
LEIAAPINPRLEKRAACTPERVWSLPVAESITNIAVTNQRIDPARPSRNCFFIELRKTHRRIKVTV